MPIITISGSPISFPDTSASPDWSPAIIQFAQLVATALSSVAGPYDISPQSFVIDAYNPGTNVTVPNLSFSSSTVRAAFIKYSCHRQTNSVTLDEAGMLLAVYNPTNPNGNKWDLSQERSSGSSSISITISDDGQVLLSTDAISGLNHAGTFSFSANAFSQ